MRLISILLTVAVSFLGCSFGRGSDVDGVKPSALSEREWVALSKPGPTHRLLQVFVGDWKAEIRSRAAPDSKVDVSYGTSSITWILGQRFIKEDFEGEALGERFKGLGITGYDNAARRFTNVWTDSLNTALVTSYGKYLPEENRFDFVGEVYDPLRGGMKQTRSSMKILSDDRYQFVMYEKSQDREFAAFEINYTRR